MEVIDFVGFSFNNHHSSDLNIKRVTNGSRYDEYLVPQFNDETSNIPGRDGILYWNTTYTSRVFIVNIAFDNLTENQLHTLRSIFHGKAQGPLVFDEAPYKQYYVTIQNAPQLHFLCFNEEGQRIYKGEGTISFIAYDPFAIMTGFDQTDFEDLPNFDEWKDSIQWPIPSSEWPEPKDDYNYNELYTEPDPTDPDRTLGTIYVYNSGDVPTDWKLYIPFDAIEDLSDFGIGGPVDADIKYLTFQDVTPKGSDIGLLIDSASQLISGYEEVGGPATTNLYNASIYNETSGDFFQIPIGYWEIWTVNITEAHIYYDSKFY